MTRRSACYGALFCASLAILLGRWLVPVPVGAADNGDGWRLLCRLGGNQADRVSEDWVQMSYAPSPTCSSTYVSSQHWLNRAAQWIGQLLGDGAALNLYIVGVIACVLAATAVTLVAAGLPLTTGGRLGGALLVLLVLADSAIFGWFVSVLSEGAAFLGIGLTVAGLLHLQRAGRYRWIGAVVTFAGAMIAVNAKAQTLLLLPLLGVALVLTRTFGRTLLRRWLLPVGVLVAVTAGTVLVQNSGTAAGGDFAQMNAYHVTFVKIVRPEHAAADLRELGLPSAFARYQGTTWWGEAPAAYTDPLWPRYQHLVSRRAVIRYYATHPDRAIEVLHQGATDLLTARPDNIGSYPENSGRPALEQEFRVPVLSGVARLLAPLGLFALVPLWALTAAAAALSWQRARPVAVVTGFLVLAAVEQHAVASLAEGIEGVKHQVIALFCTFLGAAFGVLAVAGRRRAASPAGPPAPQAVPVEEPSQGQAAPHP